jgi:hypothetical protein
MEVLVGLKKYAHNWAKQRFKEHKIQPSRYVRRHKSYVPKTQIKAYWHTLS